MRMLPFALLLVFGCKKSLSVKPQSDSLNLAGDTGRNLTIDVLGLDKRRSKTDVHRACAIALAGNETFKKEIISRKLVCSSNLNPEGSISLHLKNLPYPAYITLFHDENLNSTLDFATFDIIVARKQGPIEGVGLIEGTDEQLRWSKPFWIEVGESKLQGRLRYEKSPFWKFVSDETWQYFYSWYLDKARDVNHPGGYKNPYCTRAEDCL